MNIEFCLKNITNNTMITHSFKQDLNNNNYCFVYDNYDYKFDIRNNNKIILNRTNIEHSMKMEFIENKNTLYTYKDFKKNIKISLNIYTNKIIYDKSIIVILYSVLETNENYEISLKRSNE